MGINIGEIIPKREIELSFLKDKIIAVDAYNTLYQFLTTIRQPDGTPLQDSSGNITSHLSGLLYRNLNLILNGIKLVYVFDGKPPELKQCEIEKRKQVKYASELKYEEAKRLRDIDAMKKYSSRTVSLNNEIIEQSKELLEAMGIYCIESPNEGEAEAASLAKNNFVWASASQDYDSLLYGTPYLVRNLTLARKRKINTGEYVDVNIELVELRQVLNRLDIDLDQLICLAILVGTDYNPGGVKGLGQKKALEIVQKYKYPFEIFKYVQNKYSEEINFDWQEIFRVFHEYELGNVREIEFPEINYSKIKSILLRYEFNEARIDSAIDRLKIFLRIKKQKGLSEFF
jgi:flap endonuclease-1